MEEPTPSPPEPDPVLELVRVYFDVENVRPQEERNNAESVLKALLRG